MGICYVRSLFKMFNLASIMLSPADWPQVPPWGILELEGYASQSGCAGHRDEAELVVAVVVRMTTGSIDCGIYPTRGGCVGVEYVVYVKAESYFPQEATKLDRVTEADSRE